MENPNIDDVVEFSAGEFDSTGGLGHGLALRIDGSLWVWGANDKGQLGSGWSGGVYPFPFQLLP